MFNFSKFGKALQCPKCRTSIKLSSSKKQLQCKNKHLFAYLSGTPIFLSDSKGIKNELSGVTGRKMVKEYTFRQAILYGTLKRLLTPVDISIRTANTNLYLDELTYHGNPDKLVLSIGGGPRRERDNLINLNIGLYPNVDIVGDAHRFPFADTSVDSIMVNAVLEHVTNADQVVAEIFRVLKPGGLVYAETSFLQHFHGYPNHYRNFTLIGHNALFDSFKQIASGAITGPFSTLITLALSLIDDFVSNKYARKLLLFFASYILVPVRLLDVFFRNNSNTHKLTSGVFYYGQKPLSGSSH